MKNKITGFTLLEVLIALFIFTILSMILVAALRTVINAHSSTAKNAERLRNVQIVLLMLSRDVEQSVQRPIQKASGGEDAAFIGDTRGFTFTHAGFANPFNAFAHSTLQRTNYYWSEDALWRNTWSVLDQAPQSQPQSRRLLENVTAAHFKYLDEDNHFHDQWPQSSDAEQTMPRAVSVELTLSEWGVVKQLYVIPAETKAAPAS